MCGIKLEEIKKVIIFYMYLDYVGNLNMFKYVDIYVLKVDFMYV